MNDPARERALIEQLRAMLREQQQRQVEQLSRECDDLRGRLPEEQARVSIHCNASDASL
jgi:uncharacterized protein involved in exopolysaccharide biosynthesis